MLSPDSRWAPILLLTLLALGSGALPATAAAELLHLDAITISTTVEDDPDQSHFHKEKLGQCDLLLWIGADGVIRVAQVTKSTGGARIADACLKAVISQRMAPAAIDGVPVDAWATLPLTWEIRTTKPRKPPELDPPSAPLAPNQSLPVTAADYPKGALQRAEQGHTRVHARISDSGQVLEVSIGESSGSPELDQASLTAIRGARFSPAFKDGKPVVATADVVVSWVPPQPAAGASSLAPH